MARSAVLDTVRSLMADFAERTGLAPAAPAPRRYLWTDAFAVGNFLGLERATGEPAQRELALQLVEQVHATLGRHRADDARHGWISGLSEEDGRAHPTRGGLRIGKPLPERAPREPFEEAREWDRDGQYFHYLTKWMLALARVAQATDDERYLRQAVELAVVAHAAFARARPDGGLALAWKMSIDLARPLVPAMGQHDPLDGLLCCLELSGAARRAGWSAGVEVLARPIDDFRALCRGGRWATVDPLGVGGLLCDALRLSRLAPEERAAHARLLPALLGSAGAGLSAFAHGGGLAAPAARRLAFRELGLAIGLHALARLAPLVEREGSEVVRIVAALQAFVPLARELESFWLAPARQAVTTWKDHQDINAVMLATSLMPDGWLGA